MASANNAAVETTSMLGGNFRALVSIVSATTSRSIGDSAIRVSAGPDNTG
jgi:hypothetical protein